MTLFRIVRLGAPLTLGEWVAAAGQARNLRLHAESSVANGYQGEAITVRQIRGDLDLLQPNSLWRRLRGKPRIWVDAFDFDQGTGEARFKLKRKGFNPKSKEPLTVAAVHLATVLGAQITDRDGRPVFTPPGSAPATPPPAPPDTPQTR